MKRLALAAIRLYQRTISRVLPPSCRFVPSCSEYGYEAIARYGIVRGGVMAVWRVLRCNPWGGHGYDPVPDSTERAADSRQQADQHSDGGIRRLRETDLLASDAERRTANSFTARTPHAPGHSLTEGLQ